MHFALKLSKSKTGQLIVWATWESAGGVVCKKRFPDVELVRLWFEQLEDAAENEPLSSRSPDPTRERHPSVVRQFRTK